MAIAGVVLGLMAGGANAALINRGGGMIHDTTLNITWLADWNYALTSGYATRNAGGTGTDEIKSTGEMGWNAAKTWANNLVYGGYSDWRLPDALSQTGSIPCAYYSCNESEMGHIYYVDWGAPEYGPYSSGSNTAALALFSNVQTAEYWSGTEYLGSPYFFSARLGNQGDQAPSYTYYAVAVRDGDVSASVPEPATLALLSFTLGTMGLVRRRKPRALPGSRGSSAGRA
jgi:hypothetical protein